MDCLLCCAISSFQKAPFCFETCLLGVFWKVLYSFGGNTNSFAYSFGTLSNPFFLNYVAPDMKIEIEIQLRGGLDIEMKVE